MGHHMQQTEKFQLDVEASQKFFSVKFVFFESKKFLSQDVCTLKFLFFEGIQGNVFTITCQSFTILSGCGRVIEIFYFWFLEKFVICDSKKIFISGCVQDKILILSGMLGVLMGCHMQQTEKFQLDVEASQKFFSGKILDFGTVKNFLLCSIAR